MVDVVVRIVNQRVEISTQGLDLVGPQVDQLRELVNEATEAVETVEQLSAQLGGAVGSLLTIRNVPPTDDGIVATEVSAGGRIVRGRYLDGREYDPSRFMFLPPTDDGLLPEIVSRNGQGFRIHFGRYLTGGIFPGSDQVRLPPTDEGLVASIAAKTAAGYRIILGGYLDGSAYPGGAGGGGDQAMETVFLTDQRLVFSSFAQVAERSPGRFRGRRPVSDGQGFEWVTPQGRLSFLTAARSVSFDVQFNGSVNGGAAIRDDSWQPYYAVIQADGVRVGDIVGTLGPGAGVQALSGTFALPAGTKRVDLIWPYEKAMDLLGLRIGLGGGAAPATVPARRMVAGGDSITHSFTVDRPTDAWSYKVATACGLELVNMGYGSRVCVGSDGAAHGALGGYVGTYMIGYNDCYGQRTPADFQASVAQYIAGWFGANPTAGAHLFMITAVYTPHFTTAGEGGPGPYGTNYQYGIQRYRDAMVAAINAYIAANPGIGARLHLVDGLSMFTNNANRLVDNVHPNNQGAQEWADNLTPQVQAVL